MNQQFRRACLLITLLLTACTSRHAPDHPDALQVRVANGGTGIDCVMMDIPDRTQKACVSRQAILDANDITGAAVVIDSLGRPAISLQLTERGRNATAQATAQQKHPTLAVLLDGKVICLAMGVDRLDTPGIAFTTSQSISAAQVLVDRMRVVIGL